MLKVSSTSNISSLMLNFSRFQPLSSYLNVLKMLEQLIGIICCILFSWQMVRRETPEAEAFIADMLMFVKVVGLAKKLW